MQHRLSVLQRGRSFALQWSLLILKTLALSPPVDASLHFFVLVLAFSLGVSAWASSPLLWEVVTLGLSLALVLLQSLAADLRLCQWPPLHLVEPLYSHSLHCFLCVI